MTANCSTDLTPTPHCSTDPTPTPHSLYLPLLTQAIKSPNTVQTSSDMSHIQRRMGDMGGSPTPPITSPPPPSPPVLPNPYPTHTRPRDGKGILATWCRNCQRPWSHHGDGDVSYHDSPGPINKHCQAWPLTSIWCSSPSLLFSLQLLPTPSRYTLPPSLHSLSFHPNSGRRWE